MIAGDVVISNVTVVPMSRDGELANQTVVIRGNRIAAVVPSAGLTVPAWTVAIDGTGKWLMPGLADMHTHVYSADSLAMLVAAGVTTVRVMFGNPIVTGLRSRVATEELLGPTIVTAGPIIDGDPPTWPGSTVLTDAAEAERVVTEQQAAGYDFLKVYPGVPREAYEALMASAKRHGMVVAGHVNSAVGLTGVLAAGQRSIEHLDGWLYALVRDGVALPPLDGTRARKRAAFANVEMSRLPGLVAQTVAAGAWNCPTLVVYDRLGRMEDVDALKREAKWLDKVPAAQIASWNPKLDFRLKKLGPEGFANIRDENALLRKVLMALVAANAPILVGTDIGNPFVIPGESMHDEIELMVAAGVPRARVMRAATADAARYLAASHERGSSAAAEPAGGVVEVGARADLLLVASDPLAGPLPLVPEGVVLRGIWRPRALLEGVLAEITKRNALTEHGEGMPPLVPVGDDVRQASYEVAFGGSPVGVEQIAVGKQAGHRVIVGQAALEVGGRILQSYQLAPDKVSVAWTLRDKTVQLHGELRGGKLVVTGSTDEGKPVKLETALPAGGFIAAPGIGGALALADRLAGMKPGDKRTLSSIELAIIPAIAVVPASYQVVRQPDSGGRRVFAVTAQRFQSPVAGELVLDDAGVISQTFGPPLNASYTRK